MDGNTAWLEDHYKQQFSYNDAQVDVFNRTLPNQRNFASLSKENRAAVKESIDGVKYADSFLLIRQNHILKL